MRAAVVMAMTAKIVGTALYFLGWRLWVRREAAFHNTVYSDELKSDVVTNIATEKSPTNSDTMAEIPL